MSLPVGCGCLPDVRYGLPPSFAPTALPQALYGWWRKQGPSEHLTGQYQKGGVMQIPASSLND